MTACTMEKTVFTRGQTVDLGLGDKWHRYGIIFDVYTDSATVLLLDAKKQLTNEDFDLVDLNVVDDSLPEVSETRKVIESKITSPFLRLCQTRDTRMTLVKAPKARIIEKVPTLFDWQPD